MTNAILFGCLFFLAAITYMAYEQRETSKNPWDCFERVQQFKQGK